MAPPQYCQCGCNEEIMDPWKNQRFKDQDHYNRYRIGKGRKKKQTHSVSQSVMPDDLANLKLGDILSLHLENTRLKDIEFKYGELKEELKQLIHKYTPVITSPPESPAPKSTAPKKVFINEDGTRCEDGDPISKDRISPYIRGKKPETPSALEDPKPEPEVLNEPESLPEPVKKKRGRPVIELEKILDPDDPVIPDFPEVDID